MRFTVLAWFVRRLVVLVSLGLAAGLALEALHARARAEARAGAARRAVVRVHRLLAEQRAQVRELREELASRTEDTRCGHVLIPAGGGTYRRDDGTLHMSLKLPVISPR